MTKWKYECLNATVFKLNSWNSFICCQGVCRMTTKEIFKIRKDVIFNSWRNGTVLKMGKDFIKFKSLSSITYLLLNILGSYQIQMTWDLGEIYRLMNTPQAVKSHWAINLNGNSRLRRQRPVKSTPFLRSEAQFTKQSCVSSLGRRLLGHLWNK